MRPAAVDDQDASQAGAERKRAFNRQVREVEDSEGQIDAEHGADVAQPEGHSAGPLHRTEDARQVGHRTVVPPNPKRRRVFGTVWAAFMGNIVAHLKSVALGYRSTCRRLILRPRYYPRDTRRVIDVAARRAPMISAATPAIIPPIAPTSSPAPVAAATTPVEGLGRTAVVGSAEGCSTGSVGVAGRAERLPCRCVYTSVNSAPRNK